MQSGHWLGRSPCKHHPTNVSCGTNLGPASLRRPLLLTESKVDPVFLSCIFCGACNRDNLSLRLFLLSPASGSVWLALFYPLPMSLQLMLLGLSSFVAVCRTSSLEHRLQRMDALPEHLAATYQRLSRFSR